MKSKPKNRSIKPLYSTSLRTIDLSGDFPFNAEEVVNLDNAANLENIVDLEKVATPEYIPDSEYVVDLESITGPVHVINPKYAVKKKHYINSNEVTHPDNEPKVVDQILKTFDLHFGRHSINYLKFTLRHSTILNINIGKRVIVSNKIRRGRPEDIKDCSPQKLIGLFKAWEEELIRRLNRDQRSDAFFASVGRFMKKIPDIFLKYIGSKCQYKAKDIRIVLKSYLRSFLNGFIVVFPISEEYDKLDVFCDYCILAFPDSKIKAIFRMMKNEGSMTDKVYLLKLEQLKIRIKASKMSYKDLWNANKCFQIICLSLSKHFTVLDGNNLKRILIVLHYLNNK